MYNKKSGKVFACCALAMALAVAATPASAFAATNKEVNTTEGGDADGSRKRANIDPTATVPDGGEGPNTDIDVWAFSQNTKYSVDVEWGAMTFEYKAEWDAENHTMGDGNWKIYDTSGDGAAIDDKANAINRVTVTNHSNAAVYAKMSYASEATYSDTTGTFSKDAANTDTGKVADAKSTWTAATDSKPGYFTLQSAADATAGAAVGNIYFMPENISPAVKTAGIKKWTKIGKITVALTTENPTPETTP